MTNALRSSLFGIKEEHCKATITRNPAQVVSHASKCITLILLNYCFPLNCVQFIIMIFLIYCVGQRRDIVKGAVMCTLLPSASGSNTDSSESKKRVRGTEND